ncbi:hypothetical protein D6817_02960 [Candidatus Pacearchaeota archaeon]|nr:MAG: hypothetical protein D6817_02960 [Candidatus Pacearchaeota archaeon]
MRIIIGVVGPIASGKSVLSKVLQQKGFARLSLSDEVREEVRSRGLEIRRDLLQDIGNEMREKFGDGYWAERLLGKIEQKKSYVIEGIRNPGEIEMLRKLGNFVLVGIDAPADKRLERALARARESDPKTLEEMKKIDERDLGMGEKTSGQQVARCMEMADYLIENNSTLDSFTQKINALLNELLTKHDEK